MAMSPWIAWNTPTMIIMIAANRMKPTAHPLVSRAARDPADEYASLVIYSSSSVPRPATPAGRNGRPNAPSHQAGVEASPFWDEVSGRLG